MLIAGNSHTVEHSNAAKDPGQPQELRCLSQESGVGSITHILRHESESVMLCSSSVGAKARTYAALLA